LFLIYAYKTYTKEEIDAFFEPITSKYGIKIVYEINEDFFSPTKNPHYWSGPPQNSVAEPIRHRVLTRYPAILEDALKKYPVDVIKNYLSAIHFSEELYVNGIKAGGTFDPLRKILYLVDNGTNSIEDAQYATHHELSSLFLSGHSFFINPWTDNNPEDYKYLFETKANRIEIYEKVSLKGTKEDYVKGFVTSYGQTEFENDFNEYSAMIFTYPKKFKEIMDQYPRVRSKFLVWLEFYQKIDPIFTEEYLFGNS
jgi:hypothetical protein